MLRRTSLLAAPVVIACLLLLSCGGGGGDRSPPPAVDTPIPGTSQPPSSTDQPVTPSFQVDATARFNQPTDIAIDSDGNFYVVDSGNQLIRRISSTGEVSKLSGTYPANSDVAVDPNDNLIVLSGTDIFRVTPGGSATLVKTYEQMPGSYHPINVAVDAWGRIYVLMRYRQIFRVERINLDNTTTSVYYVQTFGEVTGMAADAMGNIALIHISPTGEASVEYVPLSAQTDLDVHSPEITSWPVDGAYASGGAIAFDDSGSPYIAGADRTLNEATGGFSYSSLRLGRISSNGSTVELFSGFPEDDGTPRIVPEGTYTRIGLTTGPNGDLYLTDPFDHAIYRIGPTGQETLIAGRPGNSGSSD